MLVFLRHFSILVIEDNPNGDFRVENYLSGELFNHSVFYVKGLAELKVQLLTNKPYDIILFNLVNPDDDGEERITETLNAARDLPVIILTDSPDKRFSVRGLSLGIADYLYKNELSASLLAKSILYSIERKKANISLTESERRYKELFHLNPVPMWVYEINSLQFLDVNQAAIDHYGYSKEEFLNMSILDIRPKENIPEVFGVIQAYKNKENHLKRIARHLTKNGKVIYVEIAGNMIDFSGKSSRLVLATDITEKLKIEKELKISEQRFRALVQDGADLITIINKDIKFEYISPNHASILGYSSDALLYQSVLNFIHPDDAPDVFKVAFELNLESSLVIPPYRVKHANGKWVWMETIITNLIRDYAVRGIVTNSRDVSKRLENERKLQETNERYAAVAQATSDAIWDCDLQTNRTFISGSGYLKLFGYPIVNDYLEMNFWESHIHPDDSERILTDVKNAFDLGKTQFSTDYRFLRADGDYVYVFERVFVVYDKKKPIRVYGAMQDITSRKYHERILEIEREIYALNTIEGVQFDYILDKLINEIEKLIPDAICSIVRLKKNKTIYQIAGGSISSEYVKAIEGVAIGPKSGSCGTAMYRGENVIVTDIENDYLWEDYKKLASEHHLKACWSIPIKKSDGEVMGSFATYYLNRKSPKEHEINFIERAAILVGVLLENREASETLKRSNEQYDIVMKATSDTIWDMDLVRNKITYNKGIYLMFGYPPEYQQVAHARKWWKKTVHPDDQKKVEDLVKDVLDNKQSHIQIEYRFKCADGSYKYVLNRGFIIHDESNKPVRIIGAMQDITRQKEEENRLRLLELVITNASDAVLIAEASVVDGADPRIVFVNDAFTKITGFTKEEVIGVTPRVLQGPNTNKEDLDKLKQAIERWEHCEIELLNYRKNGEEFWMNLSIAPVADGNGNFTHWISIQRDVSERKHREIEREQLIKELNQSNEDLKHFSYITSHNFKAPLSNLIGFLNIVDEIPIENPVLAQIMQGFRMSTHLLNDTINDLIKILVIRDADLLEKSDTSFSVIMSQVLAQVENLIVESGAEIVTDFENAPIVVFNETYLESILLNLITNAIRYRSYARALKINIKTKYAGDFIVLTCEDNGIGIDLKRHREKIFGLYQRFHDRPNSKGMGLYLIKSQLESLGGSIDVESNIDEGTKFILKFKVRYDK